MLVRYAIHFAKEFAQLSNFLFQNLLDFSALSILHAKCNAFCENVAKFCVILLNVNDIFVEIYVVSEFEIKFVSTRFSFHLVKFREPSFVFRTSRQRT